MDKRKNKKSKRACYANPQPRCNICKRILADGKEQLAGICLFCRAEEESCGCSGD